jgi:hypothetical protein
MPCPRAAPSPLPGAGNGRPATAGRRPSPRGRYYVISVSDTGEGMLTDLLNASSTLFTTKDRGRGSGLGLPTAPASPAATAAGSVESTPGQAALQLLPAGDALPRPC